MAGASTITLPAGTYTLSIAGANEGAAETGDLDIIDDLTLSGAGADNTIVDGGALDRVFQVYSAPYVSFVPFPSVAISSMTVQNCAGSDGGGIYNEVGSTLAITNGTVSDNSADKGGAIYNAGTLTLPDSTGSGNTAGSEGGIYDKGKVDITNSTIGGDPP